MILFVGEKPSRTAFEKGWTWASKRLASATLHDALDAVGVSSEFSFLNLFGDHPDDRESVATPEAESRVEQIRGAAAEGKLVIAMGLKVSRGLTQAGVNHRVLRHPAARGAGRARHLYIDHVRTVLTPTAAETGGQGSGGGHALKQSEPAFCD